MVFKKGRGRDTEENLFLVKYKKALFYNNAFKLTSHLDIHVIEQMAVTKNNDAHVGKNFMLAWFALYISIYNVVYVYS